jgi:hypothetical protein
MPRVCQWKTCFAVCLMLTSGIAEAQKPSKQVQRFLALTPADFQSTLTVKDDALDTVARISTEEGFQEKRGLLRIVWNDNFLRAFIDKKTGKTDFQLYQIIGYDGAWRFYETVNYETPSGPDSKPVTVIDRNVDGCGTYGCSFTEHIGFDVPEDLLRQIAASYTPTTPHAWHFKFGSKAGVEFQDGINVAEAAAILSAVDQYRATHRLVQPIEKLTAAEAPPPTPKSPVTPSASAPSPQNPAPKKQPANRPAVTCVTCQ